MDLNHLLPDELEIECVVREIPMQNERIPHQLIAQLDLEKVTPQLIPNRPHTAAQKAPRREIKFCGAKLLMFQEWMKVNVMNEEMNDWVQIKSRILHTQGRLFRMLYSPSVKFSVEQMLAEVDKLLAFCDQVVNKEMVVQQEDLSNISIIIGDEDDNIDIFGAQSTGYPQPTVTSVNTITTGAEPRGAVTGNSTIRNLSDQENVDLNSASGLRNVRFSETQDVRNKNAEELHKLRELLASQPLDHLMEILNEVIITKTTVMSSNEFNKQIEGLSLMETPPSKTPFIPTTSTGGVANRQNFSHSRVSGNPDETFTAELINPHNQNSSQYYNTPHQFIPPSNPVFDSSKILQQNSNSFNSEHHPMQGSKQSTFLKRDPVTWGLVYYGSVKDPPIENFLFRVEAIASGVFHIDLNQLVNEFCAFLKDKAQNWYWMYRQRYAHQYISYVQFRHDLITRFRDTRTDYDIEDLIKNRTQKYQQREDFRTFYDDILGMISRLKCPMSEKKIIDVIRRNMRPSLQVLLASQSFNNLNDLVAICVLHEDVFNRLGYNAEASMQTKRVVVNEIYPSTMISEVPCIDEAANIAFDVEAFKLQQGNRGQFSQSCPNSNLSNSQIPKTSDLRVCFNCGNMGHHFKDCKEQIKKIFCHGCGEKDVYLPQCQKCRPGNLNFYARGKPTGMFPPRQNVNPSQQNPNAETQNATIPKQSPSN